MTVRRIDCNGALEPDDRFVIHPLHAVESAQIGVGIGIVRVQDYGILELRHRFFDAAQVFVGQSQEIVGVRVVGIDRDRLLERNGRLVRQACQFVGRAQIVVGEKVVRVESNGLEVLLDENIRIDRNAITLGPASSFSKGIHPIHEV